MGASVTRWKPAPSGNPSDPAQTQEDIRDLLLIIASALTSADQRGDIETRDSFLRFLMRRREPIPGDGH